MKSVIDCPRCNGRVTAPAGMFEHTLVRCPHCKTEYEFKEALQYAPPELEVIGSIGTATATPELKFDESMFGDGEFNLAPDYAKSVPAHEEAAIEATGFASVEEKEFSEAAVFKINADDLEPIADDAPMSSAEAVSVENAAPVTNDDEILDDVFGTDEPQASSVESSSPRQIDLEETVAFGFADDQPLEDNPPEVEAAIESALTGEPIGVPDDEAFDFLGDDAPASRNVSFDDEPVAMRMDTDADDMFAPSSEESLADENAQIEMIDDTVADTEPTAPVLPVVAKGKKGKAAVTPVGAVPGLPKKPKKKRSLVSLVLGGILGPIIAIVIVYLGLMWGASSDPLQIAGALPEAIVPPSMRLKEAKPVVVAQAPSGSEEGSDSEPDPNAPKEPGKETEPAQEGDAAKTPADNANLEIKPRSERMKDEEVKKADSNVDPAAPPTPSAPTTEIPGAAPTDPPKTSPPATEPSKTVPMNETPKDEKPSIDNPLDKPLTIEPMIPIGGDPFAPPAATPADKAPDSTKPTEPLKPADPVIPVEPMKTSDAPPVDPFGAPMPEPAKLADPVKPVEPAKPIEPAVTDPFPIPMPPVEPMKETTPVAPTDPAKTPFEIAPTEPAKPTDLVKTPDATPAVDPFAAPAPTPMPEPAKPATPEVKIVTLIGEKKFSEADLAAVVKKVKEQPDFTVETDAAKKFEAKKLVFSNMAELGEATSFVNPANNPEKIAEQLKAATDLLNDVAKNDAKLAELGGLSQAWIGWNKRTSNGIFLTGQVQQSTAQGKLFVSQVEVPGQTPVVIEVVSTSELKKGPIALVGSIVDKPTTVIPNFEGTDRRVIWASAAAGQ